MEAEGVQEARRRKSFFSLVCSGGSTALVGWPSHRGCGEWKAVMMSEDRRRRSSLESGGAASGGRHSGRLRAGERRCGE